MPSEPIPIDAIMTDLDGQWNASNVTKPSLVTVNAANQPIRFDLNVGDHAIGRTGSPAFEEEPIGNWLYGNRTYNISMEIYTRKSRQQLYNLMREVRRICHARRHSLTNFQRLQFEAFNEETQQQVNLWHGIASLQVVNQMVLLET